MDIEAALQWRGIDPLAWLLAPISIDNFIDEYWEQGPLIVRRTPGYYDDLLTFADVNAFMSRNDIRYPYLRLVKNGRELPLIDYADDFVYGSNIFPGLLDNDKVFQHYSQGATLSFQIFQKCMDSLSRFCNALEARFRFQTQVNIFVTPPRSKGFTAHYDDHSFFIFQISGSKHWKLYGNPVELPLQEFRIKTKTPDLGKPEQEITLNAGDMLYLPKGFYHEAHTTNDTSVHITLGIFPYTWIKVLERLVEELKRDIDFRRSPPDYLRTGELGAQLETQFQSLLKKLDQSKVRHIFERLFVEAASKQIVDGNNRLRDLVAIDGLNNETQLERRDILCRITRHDENVGLTFYDKTIKFPDVARDSLEFILRSKTFAPREIPGQLDDASKLVVVRKLVKEGLLSLVDARID